MSRDGYVMSAADWDCWHMGWSAHTCAKGYLREIRRKDGGVVLMHCIHLQSAALVRAGGAGPDRGRLSLCPPRPDAGIPPV